jgi:hypothetical protein
METITDRKIITVLKRLVLAEPTTLLAWAFDERLWKLAYKVSIQIIRKSSIKESKDRDFSATPAVAWPHISAALITGKIKPEDFHKMELASELYAPKMEISGIEILPGRVDDYLSLKLKGNYNFDKFFDFAIELFGKERVKDYRTSLSPEHKPHASILAVSKEDSQKLEPLLGEITKALKSASLLGRKIKADRLLTFENFEISKVHFIET